MKPRCEVSRPGGPCLRCRQGPRPAHAHDLGEVEAMLKASGLAFALLRNGWYTKNYIGSAAAAVANGVLLGSADEGRIAERLCRCEA